MILIKKLEVLVLGATVSSVLMAAPALAGTVFADSTFDTSDYIVTSYAGPTVTTAYGQTPSGNPGTALEGTYSAQGGNASGVLFTAIHTNFVYDPGVSGAIGSLSASLDRFFAPTVNGVPIAVGSYSLRILAQQDGKIYQSIFTFGPFNQLGGSWYTLATTNIKASDFKLFDPANFGAAGSATGLDFSGDAITFGFGMRSAGAVDANGDPIDLPSSGILRADNFELSIAAVPGPIVGAGLPGLIISFIGFGLIGIAMRSRRSMSPLAA